MQFTQTKEIKEKIAPIKIPFKKVLLTIVTIVVVGLVLFAIKTRVDAICAVWDELQFAYTKPNVVKAVRLKYEQEQKNLDASFGKQEKTSQEKLIDELTKQLQESNQPKK